MIKCIIFDMGGTIVPEDTPDIRAAVAKELGIDAHKLTEMMNELYPYYTTGKITLQEAYGKVLESLGKNKSESKKLLDINIKVLSRRMFNPYPDVLEYVDSLRKKYKVVLLTNTELEIIELFNAQPFIKHFDKFFKSVELKMMKPNPDIYLHVLKEMGCKPSEAIFVDDKPENVEGAAKVGIKSFVYKDLATLKKDLSNII